MDPMTMAAAVYFGNQMLGNPIGELVDGLFTSDTERAEAGKLQAMRAAAGQYDQYRPVAEQARMNALGNQLSAYQGVSNALTTMYGPDASLAQTSQQMMRSPLSGQNNYPAQRSPELNAHGAGGGDAASQRAASIASREAGERRSAYLTGQQQAATGAANAASAASAAAGNRPRAGGPTGGVSAALSGLASAPGTVSPGSFQSRPIRRVR